MFLHCPIGFVLTQTTGIAPNIFDWIGSDWIHINTSFACYELKLNQSNFQNFLAVKLNSGKPVSHCLTWFAFSLIWVMLGDSSVNSLSKQLVSPSPFSLGTYGGVTFPWRGHNYNQNLLELSQKPVRMRSSLCHGSRGAPSLLWLHPPSQSFARAPELVGFKRSGWYMYVLTLTSSAFINSRASLDIS